MEQTQHEQSLIVLQKRLPMLVTMAVAIVLCCAVVLNFTRAWYSNNLDASAEGMKIVSESPDVEFNLQIYNANGVLVYDSTNEKEYGIREWVGLLPGEKYVFVLALNRSDTAEAQNLDLQIGFLGLSGKPLGAPFKIIPNQNKFEENASAQTLSIPGSTIFFDTTTVTLTETNQTDEDGNKIATCVPNTDGHILYFDVTETTVTVKAAATAPNGAFSSTVLNFSGYDYSKFSNSSMAFPAVKYETVKDENNEYQKMVAALMQTNTGHDSTEVFKIGCYATQDTNTQMITYKAPHILELTEDQMANPDEKKAAISAEMIALSKRLQQEDNNELLSLPAYQYISTLLYEYHWAYQEQESSQESEEGATTVQPENTKNQVLLIPFCVYVDTAEKYQEAGIINSSADLSNIQFSVDGIYISALPPADADGN